MDLEAIQVLRLQLAEMQVERLTASRPARMRRAERLQRTLWEHREDLVRCAEAFPNLRLALRPFARAALIVPNSETGILVSVPGVGGRDYVQLRGADFHRAAGAYFNQKVLG